MSGGLDLVAINKYSISLQKKVQQQITKHHFGELLVGNAIYIPFSSTISFIYAPTMTVPMSILGTRNVFLATLASLRVAKEHNCSKLYLPLFGELTGRIPTKEVGRQMEEAVIKFSALLSFGSLEEATQYRYYE